MLYSCTAIEGLAQKYYEKGGEVVEIIPGTLGFGLTVMHGEGLKTAVVTEIPITTQSSGHKVRLYNKMPDKYKKMLHDYYEMEVFA